MKVLRIFPHKIEILKKILSKIQHETPLITYVIVLSYHLVDIPRDHFSFISIKMSFKPNLFNPLLYISYIPDVLW
jgi:hypothetical protein